MPLLLTLALAVFLGRFSVPGHGLTGWPGAYEALAHIALGVMLGAAIWREDLRGVALWIVAGLSLFELVMFLSR